MKYYKIVNPKGHHGLIYKEGLNVDPKPFNPTGTCKPGGIYFAQEDILAFVEYGTELYEVDPVGEIYKELIKPRKFKAHAVKLKHIGKIDDINTITMLIDEGANIHAYNNYVVCSAAKKGHAKIVKLLIELGADVHAWSNYALRYSSSNGHIEVVKLLIEAAALIHADDDYALLYASLNGHIEVVKLLIEAGANVNSWNDLNYVLMNVNRKIFKLLTATKSQ